LSLWRAFPDSASSSAYSLSLLVATQPTGERRENNPESLDVGILSGHRVGFQGNFLIAPLQEGQR